MSVELNAICQELRRLKADGIDRIYVDDATLALLKPPARPKPEMANVTQELENLIQSKATPARPAKEIAPPKEKSAPDIGKPLPEQVPVVTLPVGDNTARMAWLRELVKNCSTCKDHLSSFGKIVVGEGAPDADILFCGEAPGAEEEKAGRPFVGPAGQLLTKIIQAMGLKRENVYITNILKWRPEHDKPYGNRPPTIQEMNFCLPYLKAEIEIVQPKAIVALGATAVSGLLGPDPKRKMGQVRGQWHTFNDKPLMITFHPSYLLRNDTLGTKRKVWEDLLKVMDKLGLDISERQRTYFLPK